MWGYALATGPRFFKRLICVSVGGQVLSSGRVLCDVFPAVSTRRLPLFLQVVVRELRCKIDALGRRYSARRLFGVELVLPNARSALGDAQKNTGPCDKTKGLVSSACPPCRLCGDIDVEQGPSRPPSDFVQRGRQTLPVSAKLQATYRKSHRIIGNIFKRFYYCRYLGRSREKATPCPQFRDWTCMNEWSHIH